MEHSNATGKIVCVPTGGSSGIVPGLLLAAADYMKASEDELYDDAKAFVIAQQSASTSMLQRRFRIGYNRAARLIDDLEANQIVGPSEGSKPRKVFVTPTDGNQS